VEVNVPGDSTQNTGASSQSATAPDSPPDPQANDTVPGAVGDEPTMRRPRRRPVFRGHIVVDDDEPMAVFDAPAEAPPTPPAAS
jgi:hypothetical protein